MLANDDHTEAEDNILPEYTLSLFQGEYPSEDEFYDLEAPANEHDDAPPTLPHNNSPHVYGTGILGPEASVKKGLLGSEVARDNCRCKEEQ